MIQPAHTEPICVSQIFHLQGAHSVTELIPQTALITDQ